MSAHLVVVEGVTTFQSDKYPVCPPGKVPLSVKDKAAQPLLWQYAQTHRKIDAEFSDDLETALKAAGYSPPTVDDDRVLVIRARLAAGTSWTGEDGGHGNKVENQEPEVRRILRDCAKRIEEAGAAQDATDTRPRLVPKHDGDCTVWCHDGRCYETSTLTARELADRLAQLEDALERVA